MRGALVALLIVSVVSLGCGKSDEDGSGPTACSGSNFQTGSPVLSCCQLGQQAWYTYVDPMTSEMRVAQRSIGTPCTKADGGVGCGMGAEMCKFGPCGGAQEWNKGPPVAVFTPRSMPGVCGWSGGGESYPEPYTDQTSAPSISGTCPYTKCMTDGTPIP